MKGFDIMKDHLLNNIYISRKRIFLCIMLLFCVSLLACRQDKNPDANAEDEEQTKIYYLDASQTSIVSMDYTPKESSTSELIDELIWALDQNPKSSSMKKAKPDSIIIQGYHLTKDGRLTLDFNSEYIEFTGVEEILSRATIVNTLSQVDGVDYIEFNPASMTFKPLTKERLVEYKQAVEEFKGKPVREWEPPKEEIKGYPVELYNFLKSSGVVV